MKVRLTFRETVTYETDIELEDGTPLPEIGSDGDDDWFQVVDETCPNWHTQNLTAVTDRELENCEVLA